MNHFCCISSTRNWVLIYFLFFSKPPLTYVKLLFTQTSFLCCLKIYRFFSFVWISLIVNLHWTYLISKIHIYDEGFDTFSIVFVFKIFHWESWNFVDVSCPDMWKLSKTWNFFWFHYFWFQLFVFNWEKDITINLI